MRLGLSLVVCCCGILLLFSAPSVPLPTRSAEMVQDSEGRKIERRPLEPTTTRYLNQFRYFGLMIRDMIGSAINSAMKKNSPEEAVAQPRDPGFQITCSTCTFAVNLLISFVQNGKSEEDIARTAINVCISFKIESEMVCRGAVNSLVKPIVYIIQHSTLNEKDICGFVLRGDCEDDTYENVFNWTISFPDPQKPPVIPLLPPKEGLPTKKILHLSDTHLDPFYQEGSLGACGAPLCCRESLGMPSDPALQAGKWGDSRLCDSPQRTIENMLDHISKNHEIDLIIWTGDLPPHDIYNQSRASNMFVIKEVIRLFTKYFPNTPIFPAIGNHESFPINCYPRPEVTNEFSISWLYQELTKSWKDLLKLQGNQDVTETMEKGAYYSVAVEKGFRIISLNMNYCNNLNWYLLMNTEDPAEELQWLIKELTAAEKAKEKVYLLGHIPPGNQDCAKVWSRNFHKIIHRFENTVAAQFYGHTHYAELMLFYEDLTQRPINIAYVGASTTPYSYVNPAYTMYTVDGTYEQSTRMVLDGDTYYMNLTEANLLDKPTWRLLYSYKNAYNMASLVPTEWDKLFRKLATDKELNDLYFSHVHRKSDAFPVCNQGCRNEMVCRQVAARSGDFTMCKVLGLLPQNGTLIPSGVFT